MIRFSNEGNAVSVEEMTEVYFNDHRIKRILKSMLTTNSGIALPSLILLIPASNIDNLEKKIEIIKD